MQPVPSITFSPFIIVFVAFSFRCLCGLLDFSRQLASSKHKHSDGQGPDPPRPETMQRTRVGRGKRFCLFVVLLVGWFFVVVFFCLCECVGGGLFLW